MKVKYFAVVLLVLLIAGFCVPVSTYAAVTVDTIGTQFGVKMYTLNSDTIRSFRFKGKNSAADSTATLADSGAVAGDSSSHFLQINVGAAAAGQLDSVMLVFPRGWVLADSGSRPGLDTLYHRYTGFSDNTLLGWRVRRGTAGTARSGNDTLILAYSQAGDDNGVATTAGTIWLGLTGIYNDTSLYSGTSALQIDTLNTQGSSPGPLPVGYIANGLSTVQTSGYVDTVKVVTIQRNLGRNVNSDNIVAYIRPANKSKLVFADSTGQIATSDTAGTLLDKSLFIPDSNKVGRFIVTVADKYGNIRMRDSSTAITLTAYGSTGANPPSGNGRLRNPLTGSLSTSLGVTHQGISGAVFSNVGYTRAGSGIFLKATATSLTEANSSSFTINQTVAQTVTILTTESPTHSSPDTMTVGSTKTFEVTVTDSFSNSSSSDTLLVRNALGGTMYTTAPYYFQGVVGTYDATTASSNPDSGLTNSSGKFQFSYTTAGNVGVDTLIVTPFNKLAGASIASLATKYIIRIAAGAVAQVAITPVTTNLEVASSNIGSSRRYTNKAEVHPDTSTFQGGVVAGDTITVFVVLKDANGNVKNFSSSDIAQVTFNSNKKGTVITGSTLDTVAIGSTNFVVGKFFYRTKTTLDKDSIRATYSGTTNSPYTIFQTVGGNPYSAVLISPNKLAGTTSVAADTFPVADSLLVMGYVLDKNGNFADSGKTVSWTKVSGGGGYRLKYPNSTGDSSTTTTPADRGVTWAMLGDTLEYFGHTSGVYNFTKDTTIGSGSYNVKKTYVQAKVFSDSLAAENLVVKAAYGTKELDQIILYKQPGRIAKVDLTIGRSSSYSSTQIDTTITSGQTVYLFSKYMDAYYNVVTPDTADNSTTATITWPKLSVDYANGTTFDRTYTQDKQFKKSGAYNLGKIDSVTFVSRAGDSLGVSGSIYTDTTITQSGTPNVRVAYKTLGTKGGYDWILSKFGVTPTAQDSVRIKTTLPVALAAFRIAVRRDATPAAGDTAGGDTIVAGQPLYVRITPTDANGNDIFTYAYSYLKIVATGFTHTDTIKQPMTKQFGRSGIYMKAASGTETTLADSTMGMAFGSTDADCTFTDNTEDFIFYTSNVDEALSLSVYSVPKDTAQNDTISAILSGNIMVKNAPKDTVVLSATARTDLGFWQDTPFDLKVAIKDSFMNAVLDTGYIVSITANHNGIDGIDNDVIVTNWTNVRVKLDHQMTDLRFLASVSSDILGNTVTGIRGYLGDGVAVTSATVNAPASLRGLDFPGDAGGYIMLKFPPSANHPGMGTSASMNLPIDYYMVYRSSSSSSADAVQWAIIPASPLPTGIDSIRAVVSVKGAISTLGYYQVAAVKGDLPPGVIGADLAKPAGEKMPEDAVMGVRVNDEMNLSPAAVSEDYAVVAEGGSYVVSSLTRRVKARAVDNSLPRGVFTPGGTVVSLSDVMIVASVFGDDNNYDPVFDIVEDGVIDLRDIIWQIFRLGTTPKSGKEGALINDGVNQSASLAVESASSSDDVFSVQVSLKGTEEIAGYRFSVTYNPDHYEYMKGTEGDFMTSEDGNVLFQINDEVEGQITVVGLYTGSNYEAPNGDGILANMEFAWMGDEVSEIQVENIQLIDRSALLNELEAVMLERPVSLPNEYALGQNYPNPFNPTTTIKFSLPEASNVRLVIYNILGQKVRDMVSEDMKAGFKRIVWDGTNDLGVKVASGIYIYQIRANNFVDQKKMVFMK